MDRTIKVTGFYLKSHVERRVIENKLRFLFLGVGQVEQVSLSEDRNSARVRFYHRDALNFVSKQEWRLGSSHLRVKPFVPPSDDQDNARPSPVQLSCKPELPGNKDTPQKYSLSSYCDSRNKFWVDIPHETFTVVSCATPRRKRKRCCNLDLQHASFQQSPKRKKRKTKPGKKKKNAQLEAFAPLPFGITCISQEKAQALEPSEKENQRTSVREVFIKGTTTVATSIPWTATAAEVREVLSAATKVPENLLYVTVDGRTMTDDAALGMTEGCTLHYSVRGKGGMQKGDEAGGEEAGLDNQTNCLKKKEELFQAAKEEGNVYFGKGEFKKAVKFYTQCLSIFAGRATVYTNRALCFLRLNQAVEAEKDCTAALDLESTNIKALYRRGLARKMQENYKGALEDQLKVLRSLPSEPNVRREVDLLKKLYEQEFRRTIQTGKHFTTNNEEDNSNSDRTKASLHETLNTPADVRKKTLSADATGQEKPSSAVATEQIRPSSSATKCEKTSVDAAEQEKTSAAATNCERPTTDDKKHERPTVKSAEHERLTVDATEQDKPSAEHKKPTIDAAEQEQPSAAATKHGKPSAAATEQEKPSAEHERPSIDAAEQEQPSAAVKKHERPSAAATEHERPSAAATEQEQPSAAPTNRERPIIDDPKNGRPSAATTDHASPRSLNDTGCERISNADAELLPSASASATEHGTTPSAEHETPLSTAATEHKVALSANTRGNETLPSATEHQIPLSRDALKAPSSEDATEHETALSLGTVGQETPPPPNVEHETSPNSRMGGNRKLAETASEEDVLTWLEQVCGLREPEWKQFGNTDGDTLFAYKADELMKDFGISLGCARKIIYLRDNPKSKCQMLFWRVEDVVQFIESFDRSKQDLTALKTHEIDGAALLSYSNRNEIELELGLEGPLAMKIIAKRNKLMTEEKRVPSRVHEGDTETAGIHSDVMKIANNTSYPHHKLFLQNVLNLQPLKNPTPDLCDFVKCDLKIIYHKEKDLNKLEDSFLFLILCKPEFSDFGPQIQGHTTDLFNSITSNVCRWMQFLPPEKKKMFVVDSEKKQIYHEGQEISFKLPNKSKPKLKALRERSVADLESFSCAILFVDKNLLQDQRKGYYFDMGTRKNPEYFYFGFDIQKQYWFFDSQHDLSFSEGRIAESQAGLHRKCKLMLTDPNKKLKDTDPCSIEDVPCTQTAEYSQEELKPHEDICGTGMQESLHDQHQTMQAEREEIRNMDTSLEKDRIPTNLANSQTPKSSQEEPKSHVTPRGFKDSDVGVYEAGILDTFETAHGMIDPPSREFKLHDCADALDPKAKRAFLLKTLRFVCGCLNSRRNGTIYFGVADKNNEHYKHGEIVGVQMTTEAQSDYCSLFRKFLSKAFPGQETVVPDCVAGPTFVRIKGSCPRKCVIEVDVEPHVFLTELKIFKFDASVVYSFLGDQPKAERQKDVSGVFIREMDEGTAEPATISLDRQGLKDFTHDRLWYLREMRIKEEETSERRKKGIITMEEKQKFKTFIAECDSSRFPIFFVSKPTDAVRENMESCLSFVPRIRWAAIVDFDGDSDKDGLYSLCRTSVSSPNEFTEVPITEFVNNKSNNQLREKFNFPVKTPYIFANGKSSGENCFDSLGPNEWKNQYFPFVRTADSFFQDPSVINSVRRLLLVFVSEEAGDEVFKMCEDIRYAFGWDNLFFVFDKKTVQSKFKKEALSDDLIQHSAVLSWRDAQCIIEEVLEFQKKDRSKFVCTASGALVELPPEVWRSWEQNLEVLSAKECEEFELTSSDQWRQKEENEETNFYRGEKVSWLNFYFPGHVMERTLLSDLKHRVSELSEKVGNQEAARVIVGHMPGTGGTTMVKHLLWSLKKQYKCAVVHRITPDTERQICEFWDACECETVNERKPVILIVDNVSNDDNEIDDFELCRRLHRLQKNKNLLKPLAITVICQRSVKRTGNFFLPQDTDDTEKMWLRKKQKQLEGNDRLAGEMQTLLGFLSLRHGFDRTSLLKIILPYVTSEILCENERELIGYIALVMVYFPSSLESPGIPVISCDELMTTLEDLTTPWEKRLSKVAKYLLVVDDSNDCRHKIVRISTYACAEAILTVVQNCSLGDFVTHFLESDLLTEQSGTSYTTKRIVIKVLIERQKTLDGKNISHMSPLIMAIQAESFEKAVKVLLLGESQLKDVVFHQQLARLYLKRGEVTEAEVHAKLAVDLSRDSGEYKHTLGLVYLRMLDDAYKENCSIPSSLNETHSNNLIYGFKSLSNFVQAQKGDDAIIVSYAFCDAVKVINLILSYMCKHVLRPGEQFYNFGSFLTQEEFCMPDFELLIALEEDFKALLSTAQASLKFLYYLGFSYRNKRGRDSLKQARSQFAISYSKDTSVGQSKKLAEKLKVLVRRPDNSEHRTLCHFFRIENLKLQGAFFESIIYYVTLYNKPGISAQNKRDCWTNLELIRQNLLQIPCVSMSGEDMDNLITVCLALQMIRKGNYFTSDESNLYRFCGTLICCSDQVLQMRAHVYRTLVSWPRNRSTVFNTEEFKRSFGGKPSFLKSRNEPLSPRVHFFIARSSSDFHICHWTEIYHSEEDEGSITSTMHQRLEPFHGTVMVYERRGQSLSAIMLNLSHLTDAFPSGLKVRALRNENMLSGERVKCYLGFSLQGPVAYIYESE